MPGEWSIPRTYSPPRECLMTSFYKTDSLLKVKLIYEVKLIIVANPFTSFPQLKKINVDNFFIC